MPPESRQALSRERDVDALSVRPIRADELAARADEWSALASCSGVDPLFMSHAWLTTWWEVFGSEPGVEEACFGAIDPDGRIVGIFPLFERAARIRGVLPVRRLEWMGGFWNGPSSVLTQYTEVVGDPDLCPELIRAFVGAIADRPGWDELIVDRIRCDSPTLPLLIAAAEERGWFVRLTPLGPSRVIDLTDGFESYRASLSGKTRRRVFNLRRRLSELGALEMQDVPHDEVPRYLDLMNRLRESSKGQLALSEEGMRFHRLLIQRMRERGRTHLSYLTIDGEPISVNYSIRADDRVYGIQLGFDADAAPGLSLGMIHVGFAIEAAAEDGAKAYDLMGGEGASSGWKAHVSNTAVPVTAVQVVRSRTLSVMYRLHDGAGPRIPETQSED